jgi:tetratricopeptide (TPR) repeat protein
MHLPAWDVEDFDLFISYARRDNREGMVTALVEKIRSDFARFSPTSPLAVFFDQDDIRDLQEWQERLRKGLERSKVMLAVLSANYFASEWCQREWEAWHQLEKSRTYPGESIAPVFIVPQIEIATFVGDRQRPWWDDLRRRQGIEAQDWWPHGREALQKREVAERLERMERAVAERSEFGKKLARVPRNLRARNPHFVGRVTELRTIREALSRFETAGVCAIHGIGGIGKSSVAREYAWRFRPEYTGGQFEIDLSTVRTSDALGWKLVGLARDYLAADIPLDLSPELAFERARAAFARRAPHERVLLLLDNLNEEDVGLFSQRNRAVLLPGSENVHVVLTTRAGPARLGDVASVSVDSLSAEEALALLARYRGLAATSDGMVAPKDASGQQTPLAEARSPGTSGDSEWKAALSIVHRLGGHTLAVELVAAFLGRHPEISLAAFLADLNEYDIGVALDAVGRDDRVRQLIEHPETLVGPLFERTLCRLEKLPRRILDLAAFLPPDHVPLPWIEKIVRTDPELAGELARRPFRPEPFQAAIGELDDLQLLVRPGNATTARIHRVVQSVQREGLTPGSQTRMEELLRAEAAERSSAIAASDALTPARWEIAVLDRFVTLRSMERDRRLGRVAMETGTACARLGDIGTARRLLELAGGLFAGTSRAESSELEIQKDAAQLHSARYECEVFGGNPRAAVTHAEAQLKVARGLMEAFPTSAEVLRILLDALDNLGDAHLRNSGHDLALPLLEEALALAPQEAQRGVIPVDRDRIREAVLRFRLADVQLGRGDAASASESREAALEILRSLPHDVAQRVEVQNYISVALVRQGDLVAASGGWDRARRYYEESLAMTRARVTADPENDHFLRELSSRYVRLAECALHNGDVDDARQLAEKAFEITRGRAERDSHNVRTQRDLDVACRTYAKAHQSGPETSQLESCLELHVATLCGLIATQPEDARLEPALAEAWVALSDHYRRAGNLLAASARLEEAIAVRRRLIPLEASPAAAFCDLSASYLRLGELHSESGNGEAALQAYEQAQRVLLDVEAGCSVESTVLQCLRTSSAKLAEAHFALGNLTAARFHWEEAVSASRRLAEDLHDRRDLRFNLAGDLGSLAQVMISGGDMEEGRRHYLQALEIVQQLGDTRAEAVCRGFLAELANRSGDPAAAASEYALALALVRRRAADQPDQENAQRDLARTLSLAAKSRIDVGDFDEARQLLNEGISAARQALEVNPDCPVHLHALASFLAVECHHARMADSVAKESRALRECVEVSRRVRDLGHRLTDPGEDEEAIWQSMIDRLNELEAGAEQ